MNDRVRRELSEIIQRYGRDICNEPKRCKGLLLDHCAGDRREVFVLVSALEENVVNDLLAGLSSQSWGLVARRLTRRLVEHRAMAEGAALWAVESWALALGAASETAIVAAGQIRPRQGPKPPLLATPARPHLDLMTTRVGQIALRLIPGGKFRMGSPANDRKASDDEKPRHEVEISEPFYLGVAPVTQAQFEEVMGHNPSHFQGRLEHPVESVTWFGALTFCNKLSRKNGLSPYYIIRRSKPVDIVGGEGYRLPTEAEWEYACRAGTEGRYGFGDQVVQLGSYAWYSSNSGGRTCPVGRKRPNAFGLYDMHGNVWEWCWDGYEEGYYRHSPAVDPLGAEEASCRVTRGGGWNDAPGDLRAAGRVKLAPSGRCDFLGFRVARNQPDH